jgi:hypothetical protein
MCVTRKRRYRAGANTPSAARDFVTATVMATLTPSGWTVADAAVLVTSELVSTAVRSRAGVIEVLVEIHRTDLEIAVIDDGSHPRNADPPHERARSEAVIDAFSAAHGIGVDDDGRARTWARLPCNPTASGHIQCSLAATIEH